MLDAHNDSDIEIPSCKNIDCGPDAYCKDLGSASGMNSTTCFCQSGFVGDPPQEKCKMLLYCDMLHQPCSPGKCINVIAGYECDCPPGYEFVDQRCMDIDECASAVATCAKYAVCINTVGSYKCECMIGFEEGESDECVPIDRCESTDPKYRLVCSANAYCRKNRCTCFTNYTGDGKNCVDIDECASDPSPCSPRAACVNLVGGYNCSCKRGYRGNGFQCADINECAEMDRACDVHASCMNLDGGYRCICQPGWDGDSPKGMANSCPNVDECSIPTKNTCDPATSTCQDLPGDYACNCKPGYRHPSGDNNKLCVDINECVDGGGNPCGSKGSCVNINGGYFCECFEGYAPANDDQTACVGKSTCPDVQ
ncbi:unnamed protein product [Soboliphyme baturini]|uniref:EGF-like domain-containing protein n=1 Tax=Soboliphyme baturini TaxID=241478 RepID=A0A183J2T9_9BILA|nr:unnamed protein product [Soboliphyme baturini]